MCNAFVPSPPLSVQLRHKELSGKHCPEHPTVSHFLFCLLIAQSRGRNLNTGRRGKIKLKGFHTVAVRLCCTQQQV